MRKPMFISVVSLVTFGAFWFAQTPPSTQSAPQAVPTPIDIAHASAPLFDDATFHGASDPFVIWNPAKALWFMYYTQRRATLSDAHGVDWVHGSAIGIATSKDGTKWDYVGTCEGDHDLSEPLKATGAGPEPGITWWAPCFLNEAGTFHMFVTRVDGVYTKWTGKRNIVHFTSSDGIHWTFVNTCTLSSDRVIDPTVYPVNGTWYMVYKDEAAGSNTFRSQSKDLLEWTTPVQITHDGSQEAPFVFHWKNSWWLIVDAIAHHGLRLYKSSDGINEWKYAADILNTNDGTRPTDRGVGHHPGIVLQGGPEQNDQCLVFYFTQQGRRTLIQLAELELGADGIPFCNRNKYASATTAPAH
jgi:hypothetical protein